MEEIHMILADLGMPKIDKSIDRVINEKPGFGKY